MLGPVISGLLLIVAAAAPVSADLESRRKAFQTLLSDQWEYQLAHGPEFASILGDKRFNDKVSDLSQKGIEADQAMDRVFLARFDAIDATGFPEQEALTRTLQVRAYKESIAREKFHNWEMPVNQISGIHLNAPQLVSLLPFATVKDYDDYAVRIKAFPKQIDDVMDRMRKGMTDGLMPPRFLLEKVITQAEGIAGSKAEDSPFARPLAKMPATCSEADRGRIREAHLAAIGGSVLPAYAKFAKFVREEYAPKGRTEPGMWSLPDGEARYAAAVKNSTTTDLTPEQIHQIGLAQVAAIEKQMLEVAKSLGFSDLPTLNAAIEKNPKLHPKSREEILTIYRGYIDQMKPQLPKLFGRLPKAGFEVAQVEAFREKEASGASYNQPAQDAYRPGRLIVNTSDPTSRKTVSVASP